MHRFRLLTAPKFRAVAAAALAAAAGAATAPHTWADVTPPAASPPPAAAVPQLVIEDDDAKDAEWDVEKEKCSFCRQFLQSPCKAPFRRWSKCVDLAKEKDLDFVKACKDYTNALMDCTSENSSYFEELNKSDEDADAAEAEAAEADAEAKAKAAEGAKAEETGEAPAASGEGKGQTIS